MTPDDQYHVGESECGDEAGEEEPQNDHDDSEDDHGYYLVSVWMFEGQVRPRISV